MTGNATAGNVTVVIPTFNRAALLVETLTSLIAQTVRSRVIVVDDCSTDCTEEVCAAFPGIDYVRNDRRLGLFANWNRALKLVTTEFVALYHDDDVYEAVIVERECDLMRRHPDVVMVHTGFRHIDDDGREIDSFIGAWPTIMDGEELRGVLAGRLTSPIAAPSAMLRTDAVRRIGYFNEALHVCGDLAAWMKLGRLGKIGYVPEALVSVRQGRRFANRHRSFDWAIIEEQIRVAEDSLLEVRGARTLGFRLKRDAYIALFLGREMLAPTPNHGAGIARAYGSPPIRALARLVPALSYWAGLTKLDHMVLRVGRSLVYRGVKVIRTVDHRWTT